METIRLINFIRTAVAAGGDPRPALQAAAAMAGTPAPWSDDRYLQPALADDGLMFHDWEGDDEDDAAAAEAPGGSSAGAGGSGREASASASQLQQLREENEALRGMLEAMRSVVLADEGVRELVAEAAAEATAQGSGSGAAGASTTTSQQQQQQQGAQGVATTVAPADAAAKAIDDSYFDSYSTFDIHREMLSDKVGEGGVWW